MLTPVLAFLTGLGANAIAGVLASAKLGLFTNTPTLTRSQTMAGLTQPTFTGYAEAAITWGSQGEDVVGNIIYSGGLSTFQPTGTTGLPQTANGWYISVVISSVETLLLLEYLPTPFNFVDVLSQLGIVPTIVIPNQPVWGDGTVISV